MPAEVEAGRPLLRRRPFQAPARRHGEPSLERDLGVLLAGSVAVLALLGTAMLPGGSLLRLALAGAMVFVVPGYLLLEAAGVLSLEGRTPPSVRALVTLGLSPAVVGLVALATAIVPGAFRPDVILGAVTVVSLGLAAAAFARRRRAPSMAEGLHTLALWRPADKR